MKSRGLGDVYKRQMLDTIGYRELTSKAIVSHTIGGLAAALAAHWGYLLYAALFI